MYGTARSILEPVFEEIVSHRYNAKFNSRQFADAFIAVAADDGYLTNTLDYIRGKDKEVEMNVQRWERHDSCCRKRLDQKDRRNRNTECPTPQHILGRLKKKNSDELFQLGTDALENTIRMALGDACLSGPVTLAVDTHDIPCHAPMDDNMMRRSKPKGGTSKMDAYMTVQVVDDISLTVSAFPYTTGDSIAEMLRNTIHNVRLLDIQTKKLLLDRGFYSVAVMRMLREEGIPFIMAVPKKAPIKTLVEQFHEGKSEAIVPYTVGEGKNSENVNLLMFERRDADKHDDPVDKYMVLAFSGIQGDAKDIIQSIPEEYRGRWSIETGYRIVNTKSLRNSKPGVERLPYCLSSARWMGRGFPKTFGVYYIIEQIRARTRSMAPGVRWFFFLMSAALVNIWAIANHLVQNIKSGVAVPVITLYVFAKCLYQKVTSTFLDIYKRRWGKDPPWIQI